MKRSYKPRLGLVMGAAALLSVAACDDTDVEVKDFASVSDCNASGIFTYEQCEKAFEEAMEAHLEAAPRYSSISACEADFGQCTQTSGSGGTFSPFMMGFLVGGGLDAIEDVAEHKMKKKYYQNGGSSTALYRALPPKTKVKPYYRTTSGQAQTATGAPLKSTISGTYKMSEKAYKAKPTASSVKVRSAPVRSSGFGMSGGRSVT